MFIFILYKYFYQLALNFQRDLLCFITQVLWKPFSNKIYEKLQYDSLVYSENDRVFNLKWVKKIWNDRQSFDPSTLFRYAH